MKTIALIALAFVAAFLAFQGSLPSPALAATTTWDLRLMGIQENPPVVDPAVATAHLIFDDATRTLTYTISVSGVAGELVTAAHIHAIGAVGVNSAPKYPLLEKGMLYATGKVTIDTSDVPALLAGDMYVNLHTQDHPGGAARAQIEPTIKTIYRMEANARNKGDVPMVMALYADNAQQIGGGLCGGQTPCLTKAAIQRNAENGVVQHLSFRATDIQVAGNVLTMREETINDASRAAGVTRFISLVTETYQGTFQGDKIVRKTISQDASDPETATFLAFQSAAAARASSVVISPPNTGDAGLIASGPTSLLPLLGVLAFAMSGTAVFALARRRED